MLPRPRCLELRAEHHNQGEELSPRDKTQRIQEPLCPQGRQTEWALAFFSPPSHVFHTVKMNVDLQHP